MWLQQGLNAKKDGAAEEAERMLVAASTFYKKAAGMYPPDDEMFPCERLPRHDRAAVAVLTHLCLFPRPLKQSS